MKTFDLQHNKMAVINRVNSMPPFGNVEYLMQHRLFLLHPYSICRHALTYYAPRLTMMTLIIMTLTIMTLLIAIQPETTVPVVVLVVVQHLSRYAAALAPDMS